MTSETTTNTTKTYYGLTLDPLHIGTGGYRLGRVDNTIVREPGTELPIVPGTSISGVCRNYAIYGLSGTDKADAMTCASQEKENKNCGKCRICKTFGYANGTEKKSRIGLVKFFDAGILAFPVSTMCGPVWVTSAGILKERGGTTEEPKNDTLYASFKAPGGKLNLGWLYLDCAEKAISLPAGTGDSDPLKRIKERLVVAPDYLFPEIVNSNLEVRTSVSIDFETGAAADSALFTYEAVPRATLFAFDVAVDTFRCRAGEDESVREVVSKGFALFETLGMGGMNTRGFGRMRITNYKEVKP